jgi:hypothetical protein
LPSVLPASVRLASSVPSPDTLIDGDDLGVEFKIKAAIDPTIIAALSSARMCE